MSRTRSRSESSGSVRTGWGGTGGWISADNGATIPPLTPPEVSNYETSVPRTMTESITDTSTPSFKKLSAKGQIVLSPMSKTSEEIINLPVTLDGSSILYRSQYSTAVKGWRRSEFCGERPGTTLLNLGSFPTPPSVSQTVKDLAISRAFSNISLSEAQLWATLGEGKETIKMLHGILKSVYNLVFHHKVKLQRLKRKKNSPDDIAKLWMELRYGIRPLYYEARGIWDALHAEPPDNMRQTFRGFSKDAAEAESFATTDWKGFRFTTRRRTETKVQARAGVLTDVSFLGAIHTFGLAEIPQSLWELVPFSFIIDWFLNISQVIASWSPKPGFKTLGSWVVLETTTTYTAVWSEIACYPAWVASTDKIGTYRSPVFASSPFYQRVVKSVVRTINPSLPILPSFDVKLDPSKLIDLAIILRNLV